MGKLKRWRLRRAYRLVLKDLFKVNMFRGVYDAVNGDEVFMYGIGTVMETIAFEAGDFNFEQTFNDNMTRSEIKAGVVDDKDE